MTDNNKSLFTKTQKIAKAWGFNGDINDREAVIKFAWGIATELAKDALYLERMKREGFYDKQLTDHNLEKAKRYNTSGKNKPNNNKAKPEVIKKALLIKMDQFVKGGNLGTETTKLIDNALIQLAKNTTYKGKNSKENYTSTINIKDYLRSQKKEPTQKEIYYFLKRLRNEYTPAIKSMYMIPLKGKIKGDLQLISNILYDNTNIYVYFFPPYAEYLTAHSKIKNHARCLNQLGEAEANAYYLGVELEYYYGMKGNRKRGLYNKRKVTSLLEKCSKIPTEEEVKKSNARNCKVRIIQPFEKALKTLTDIGFMKWEYVCNLPLKETEKEQLENKKITDFKLLKKLYITYELFNFPDDFKSLKSEKLET